MLTLQALSQSSGLLPPWAQQALHHAGHFAANAALPRLDAAWMHGLLRGSGAPARLLVVGEGLWATYLSEQLLRPGWRTETLAHLRAPGLRRWLERHRDEADLLCVRLDRGWARLVLDADFLEVPEWIGAVITLPEDLEGFFRANESRYSDVRRLRREGYDWEVSHTQEDLDCLHRDFHAPFIQRRFGQHAHVAQAWLWRQRLAKGGVLWVRHQGQRIAGLFYTLEGEGLRLFATGCIDDPRARQGFAGLYVFACTHAHALGLRTINLGGCRPTFQDGIFRYKRKWGARFARKPDQYFDYYLWWKRPSAALRELFTHSPLVVSDGDGLAWLAQPPSPDVTPSALAGALVTQGIGRTLVLSEDGAGHLPAGAALLDPRVAGSSRELVSALSPGPIHFRR